MTVTRLAAGFAALTLAGATLIGTAGAVSAQQNPGFSQCNSANRTSGQGGQGPGPTVSNPNAQRGQRQASSSGCARFAPGRQGTVGVESTFQQVGTFTANEFGEATIAFDVPLNLADGRHDVVFTGPAANGTQNTVRAGFNVTGGPTLAGRGAGAGSDNAGGAAGSGGSGSAQPRGRVAGVLPRTGGAELVAIGVGGALLVAAGGGMIVASRRRREDTPAGLA